MQLSVIIPVKDEAENIEALADEIRAALAEGAAPVERYEVLFVDDGSRDDTAAILRRLRAEPARHLRVIRHGQACGQSTAIHDGVRYARHDWILTLDGDGQNDPADIPTLVRTVTQAGEGERPDMVVGHRIERRDTWLKRISSRIANAVRSRMLGDATPDTGCSLKLFRRDLFLAMPYFDHMHRFLPALALREGARVVSVPVRHRPRTHGHSKYGLHDRLWVGIVDMLAVRWLIRRDRRTSEVFEDRDR